ncbi:patatin-like phospholipase family protein [Hoyosella altamirensis]|uniref:Putative patatin/cPLA2 family phospholipase n=1 Tax=Hoyosella altamirensis TaxID=616997 RepID=A0A839RMJ5_9ACTN|nr:patatin-like phospholipase family protein [Hoyosella altamirensis]MBB3037296.1 putative patatin/cPLA2 family phospholipase [Hoyosella altamirensis]
MTFTEHPVVGVLRARRSARSTPGKRHDTHRVAFVVEGGGPRGAYSAGMLTALKALGLIDAADALFGVSAGAFNAAWVLAGQSALGASLWSDPAVTSQTFRGRNVLRGRPIVDSTHLVRTVYTRQVRMNFQAVLDHPISFHPVATDADTGESVDLCPLVSDVESLKLALEATSTLPLLGGPPVKLGGRRFVDAGVSEPVPVHRALQWQATHILVLRTNPATVRPEPIPRHQRWFMRAWLQRRAPGTVDTWLARFEREMADDDVLERHETNGASPSILQIRPPDGAAGGIRGFRDLAGMQAAVDIGHRAMLDAVGSLPES